MGTVYSFYRIFKPDQNCPNIKIKITAKVSSRETSIHEPSSGQVAIESPALLLGVLGAMLCSHAELKRLSPGSLPALHSTRPLVASNPTILIPVWLLCPPSWSYQNLSNCAMQKLINSDIS